MNTATRACAFSVAAALVLIAAGTATGATYTIRPDGTGDFPTIQAAVNAAVDDDIIELIDGTYTGDGNRDIQVPSRPIAIRSQSNSYERCIIDCEGSARAEHRGFHFQTNVGTGNPMLRGIGIINGYTTMSGGGIWVEGASPEIRTCAVEMCTAAGSGIRGGGIYVSDGADPDFYFCVVSQNSADDGGGVAIVNSGCLFWDSEIGDNTATNTGGGVYIQSTESITFSYSDIVSNTSPRAGGVRMLGSSTSFFNDNISRNEATSGHSGGVWLQDGHLGTCTIVENSATEGGGGVHCEDGSGSIDRSIIAFTEGGYGVAATSGNAPTLTCCDVFGNAGGNYDSVVGDQTGLNNNFSEDPEFCDRDNADYRLFDTSPCLAANSPCTQSVGRWGQGCDDPVEGMSWGRLKGMYR
ncbi:MAG: right-handed parallel beta-helix repeat-containing protein [Candidatus Eisenbacteria bacterium]